jgi:hypothetical protein
MHERRERKKRTFIREERTINKIGLIISNILEKLSGLIILNRGSIILVSHFIVGFQINFIFSTQENHS